MRTGNDGLLHFLVFAFFRCFFVLCDRNDRILTACQTTAYACTFDNLLRLRRRVKRLWLERCLAFLRVIGLAGFGVVPQTGQTACIVRQHMEVIHTGLVALLLCGFVLSAVFLNVV